MDDLNSARRAFLITAAAGSAAVASAGLTSTAIAQTGGLHGTDTSGPSAQHHSNIAKHGAFLKDSDADTVAALTERLMPGAPGLAGARDAGVLNYIDLALSGAYSDLQDFYRRGLAQLDVYCRATYNSPFSRLSADRQDEVLAALEQGKVSGFRWPTAQAFFNTVRVHTMEGMFADPIYGGNKDFVGWLLIGFPGAQPQFTAADMASKDAYSGSPIVGLQAQSFVRKG